MSLPNDVIMKTDAKLNFMDASNVSLGTRNGYSSITTVEHTATGASGQFQDVSYSITSNEFMDSDVKLRAKLIFRIYKSGADVGEALADVKDKIGLAPFPVNRLINTAKIQLNGMTKSTNVNEAVNLYAPALDREIATLISPCFAPDSLSNFPAGATLNNPLRFKDDTSRLYSSSRGLGVNYTASVEEVASGVASAPFNHKHFKVSVEITERLMASPFQWNLENPQPFYQPRNFSVNLNLIANPLNHIVNQSINKDYLVGSLSADSPCDLKLVTTTFTPHLQVSIPETLYYNNPSIQRKAQRFNQMVVDGNNKNPSQTLNLNAINISGMPSMFALCVENEDSLSNPFLPCQTFNITNVNIRFGSKSGILQGYSQRDLYDVSRRNGYNLPWVSFSGQKSDVTASDYSGGSSNNCWFYFSLADLDTEQFLVSNSDASAEIQISVTVENRLGATATPLAVLYYVNDDVSWDVNGKWNSKDATISSMQIENAKIQYEDMNESENVLGGRKGKFWRGLKNFVTGKPFRNVVRAVRKSPLGAVLPGAVHTVADIAGYGQRGAGVLRTAGAKRKPAKRKPAKRKGGAVLRTAGKKMTKAEMKRKYGL